MSATRPAAAGGARAGEIGTVAGAAGTAQVTYNGHPLYYFVGDRKPGQTAGQGLNQFGARWYVLSRAYDLAPGGAGGVEGRAG
jgi:predicted lipoprotein with Yx(FWY)xxD motif